MAVDALWESFKRRRVFGFHGNTESRIAAIEQNGFRRGALPGDWLGGGFYFWQDAPARAWEWADDMVQREAEKHPEAPEEEPMVLLAQLEFNDYWIDLIESSSWFSRLKRVAKNLEDMGLLPEQTPSLPHSELHERDGELIERAMDAVRLAGERVDAIRCAFIEGNPLCENSAIYDKAHVQITVRNSDIVQIHTRIERVGKRQVL